MQGKIHARGSSLTYTFIETRHAYTFIETRHVACASPHSQIHGAMGEWVTHVRDSMWEWNGRGQGGHLQSTPRGADWWGAAFEHITATSRQQMAGVALKIAASQVCERLGGGDHAQPWHSSDCPSRAQGLCGASALLGARRLQGARVAQTPPPHTIRQQGPDGPGLQREGGTQQGRRSGGSGRNRPGGGDGNNGRGACREKS